MAALPPTATSAAASFYGGDDPLAPPADLPLWRARVLITAPRGYAGALGARLLSAGADLVWVPGVRTQRLGEVECGPLDAALAPLVAQARAGGDSPPPYAGILFSSRAGVEAVLERLGQLTGDVGSRPTRADAVAAGGAALAAAGVPLWALGADAGALTAAGAVPVRTPAVPSTAGLVAALRNEGPWGRTDTFLAPVPAVGGGLTEPPVVPAFLAGLAALPGAPAVRAPPAYATLPGLTPGAAADVRTDLEAGRVGVIVFTSTAEAAGLAGALGEGDTGRAALADAVTAGRVVLAAHGPTTAAGVEAVLGCRVAIVSRDASSFAGVVEAVERGLAGERARAG